VVTSWKWNVWHSNNSNILSTKIRNKSPPPSETRAKVLSLSRFSLFTVLENIFSILYLQQIESQQEIRCSVSLSLFSFLCLSCSREVLPHFRSSFSFVQSKRQTDCACPNKIPSQNTEICSISQIIIESTIAWAVCWNKYKGLRDSLDGIIYC